MTSEQDHLEMQELLGAHALGAVDEAQQQEINAHLQHCEACRKELIDLRDGVDLLPDRPEPSPEVWDRIVAAARADEGDTEAG